MQTNTILSKKLFYILFNILYSFLCRKITLDELKNIVRKNDSKNWLDTLNMTNSTNPYCHLCCIRISSETIGKHCGSHTLCKYLANRTGPACRGYIPINFTPSEKTTLLDAHNTLRNIVASGLELRGNPGPQPSAANMRILEWNDELALIAERWAAQCIYSYDLCRDLERFPVGQNIAHGNLATNNELSFIKGWYDEVQHFQSRDVRNFKMPNMQYISYVTGKYSQLIWADTYQIGCARAVFQESTGANVSYREHFICNYGPSGNIPNQPVYLVGTPCSACHEGTSCTLEYPSLCGGDRFEIEQEEHSHKPAEFKKEIVTNRAQFAKGGCEITSGSNYLVISLCIYLLYL